MLENDDVCPYLEQIRITVRRSMLYILAKFVRETPSLCKAIIALLSVGVVSRVFGMLSCTHLYYRHCLRKMNVACTVQNDPKHYFDLYNKDVCVCVSARLQEHVHTCWNFVLPLNTALQCDWCEYLPAPLTLHHCMEGVVRLSAQ